MSLPFAIMNDGTRIGRVAGIDITVATSFLPLGLMLVLGLSALAGGFLGALLMVLLLAGSIVAHELGHALTARAFGIRTRSITLHLLGGVAKIEGEARRPAHEILIAAAGPAVSLLLAGVFLAAAAVFGLAALPGEIVLLYLAASNLVLAIFNLLPGLPLDGGRILRGILWARSGDRRRATIRAARGGEFLAYGIFALALLRLLDPSGGFLAALFPALMGWFLLSAARAEKRRAELEGLGLAAGVRGLETLLRMMGRPAAFRGFVLRPRPVQPEAHDGDDGEVIRLSGGRELYTGRPSGSNRAHE